MNHGQEEEVRITKKESRKENPGLFVSVVDKDQGFHFGKRVEKRTDRTGHTDRSRIVHSKITYGRALSRTPPKKTNQSEFSPLSQSRNIMSEVEASHLMNRIFKNEDVPPNPLFKDAEKSLMRLNKIDQELDSRRETAEQPIYSPLRHANHNSHAKEQSSSWIAEKYTEDWEKMI